MHLTVLCNGEPIGHVELHPSHGLSSGDLEQIPAFDRYRPLLARRDDAGWALSQNMGNALSPELFGLTPEQTSKLDMQRMLEIFQRPPLGGPDQPIPGQAQSGGMSMEMLRQQLPDAARRLGTHDFEAAVADAERLHFTLRDEAGADVPFEHLVVTAGKRMTDTERSAPRVNAAFRL